MTNLTLHSWNPCPIDLPVQPLYHGAKLDRNSGIPSPAWCARKLSKAPEGAAICIQGLGVASRKQHPDYPRIFQHAADAVDADNGEKSVFMKNGADYWHRYMIDVCREYTAAGYDMPWELFLMDIEDPVRPRVKNGPGVLAASLADPRAKTEPIFGFCGATLHDLYIEAGSPYIRPSENWEHPSNHEAVQWADGIYYTAMDAAMKWALYDVVHWYARFRGWERPICCNWSTSVEGVFSHQLDWMKSTIRASSDILSPAFYGGVDAEYARDVLDVNWDGDYTDTEGWAKAAYHYAKEEFGANVASGKEVMAWLPLTGQEFKRGNRPPLPAVVWRAILDAAIEVDIVRFCFWSDSDVAADPANWQPVAEALG